MLPVFQRFYQFILHFFRRYTIRTNLLSLSSTPEQHRPQVKSVPRRVELPIEIWLEIFEFATYVHRDATIVPLNPFTARRTVSSAIGTNTPSMAKRTKLSLVLVSRAWRALSIRLLYRHLEIRSLDRGNHLLTVLRNSIIRHQDTQSNHPESAMDLTSSGYGQWTRHVEVYTFTRGTNSISYLQTVFEILKLCPQLSTFSGNWIHPLPPEFLNAISSVLGSSLDSLLWSENINKLSPRLQDVSFFGSFQSLRTLDLRLFSKKPMSMPSIPSSLSLLRNLILSTSKESLEFATVLSMPSLQNLILRSSWWNYDSETLLKSFLEVHGASFRTIDLPMILQGCELDTDNLVPGRTTPQVPPSLFLAEGVCPNLEVFTFPITSPVVPHCSHPSLRHLGLRGGNVEGLYPDKPSPIRDYLLAINLDKFPKLELIQTVGFLVEAYTDTIIKDIFIWWVEHFEKMGVMFLDGEGVLWKYHDDPVAITSHSTESSGLDNGIINCN